VSVRQAAGACGVWGQRDQIPGQACSDSDHSSNPSGQRFGFGSSAAAVGAGTILVGQGCWSVEAVEVVGTVEVFFAASSAVVGEQVGVAAAAAAIAVARIQMLTVADVVAVAVAKQIDGVHLMLMLMCQADAQSSRDPGCMHAAAGVAACRLACHHLLCCRLVRRHPRVERSEEKTCDVEVVVKLLGLPFRQHLPRWGAPAQTECE